MALTRLAAALLGGLALGSDALAAPRSGRGTGAAALLGGAIERETDATEPPRQAGAASGPLETGGPTDAPRTPDPADADGALPLARRGGRGGTSTAAGAPSAGLSGAASLSPPLPQTHRTRSSAGDAGVQPPRSRLDNATTAPIPTAPAGGPGSAPLASASAPNPEPGVLVPQGSAPRAPDPARPDGQAAGPERRELVLDRRRRQLTLLVDGLPLRRFPVAVGMPGWETPVGRFAVMEMRTDPVWEHPVSGLRIAPGPDNPLGSRWIGFHRDCRGRRGFNGKEHLVVQGCVVAGFHGTPNRDSIGRAVSHGCVRLYDEHVRDLFELVRVGTPVTVLP